MRHSRNHNNNKTQEKRILVLFVAHPLTITHHTNIVGARSAAPVTRSFCNKEEHIPFMMTTPSRVAQCATKLNYVRRGAVTITTPKNFMKTVINKVNSCSACYCRHLSSSTSSFPASEFPKLNKYNGDRNDYDRRRPSLARQNDSTKNYTLEKYKEAGLLQLEETTRDLITATRNKPLFGNNDDGNLPTPSQIVEGQRIQSLVEEAIDFISERKNDPTFCIKGDPIMIDEVEVSRDHKLATVYWSLPLSLMYIPEHVANEIVNRMQTILIKRGGVIQKLVHGRLRHYYPPKLRYEPSSGSKHFEVRQSIEELFQDISKR